MASFRIDESLAKRIAVLSEQTSKLTEEISPKNVARSSLEEDLKELSAQQGKLKRNKLAEAHRGFEIDEEIRKIDETIKKKESVLHQTRNEIRYAEYRIKQNTEWIRTFDAILAGTTTFDESFNFNDLDLTELTISSFVFENVIFKPKLTGTSLISIRFIRCTLNSTDFTNAKLIDITFESCGSIHSASFDCTSLSGQLKLIATSLDSCRFHNLELGTTPFPGFTLKGSILMSPQGKNLASFKFDGCTITNADPSKLNLDGADLSGSS